MRRIIYIAGPMAKGPMADNISRAMVVAEALIRLGYSPIMPQLSFYFAVHYPHTWEEWLDIDKPLVLRSDGIIRLDGESKGADLEVQWATEAGLPVFTSVGELHKYFNGLTAAQAAREAEKLARETGRLSKRRA